MSEQLPAERDDLRSGQDPWERYGWVMAGVWLVFLVFPFWASLTSEAPWVVRILVAASVAAFAVVYLRAFLRLRGAETSAEQTRLGVRNLAVLGALVVVMVPVVGWEAIATFSFLVSLAMFTLPLRWAAAVFAALLGTAVVLPLAAGRLGDLWFFVLIIGSVGTATGLVRLIDDRQSDHRVLATQLAVADEQERVARDLHDVLGHSLTVISLKAQLAERLMTADPEAAASEVRQVHDLARQALAEARSTVGGLRIARLGDEMAAARSVLGDAGITATLPADLTVVDPRHRIVLAWSLREAVTNVVRHSGASRCTVEVGEAHLVVSDDGRGVSGSREGHGIRGLRERVEAAGGTLSWGEGADGLGTSVVVRW